MGKNTAKQEVFATDNYKSMFAPRYCGITTFMRTPLVYDPSKLDITLTTNFLFISSNIRSTSIMPFLDKSLNVLALL